MKDFKVLRFLDKFRVFFEKLGVNYDVMRKILQIKFIMDGRRVSTTINISSKHKNEGENNFEISLWFCVFFGIILVPIVVMGENFIFQMSLVFECLMIMLILSLVSDFSSVLLDIRDKNIISSKPVDSKTLNMAKNIHVLIYMFCITVAMSGPALVASLIKHGVIFFLIFLSEIILMDLFIVVFTALLYFIMLKFFDGEKLKNIINYFQITLITMIIVGYQLSKMLFKIFDFNAVFNQKWCQYFAIPTWFGAPFEMILHGNYNIYFKISSILLVVVPVISIIVYIKLIPSFERSLQKLNNSTAKVKKGNRKIFNKLSKVICLTKQERIFFRFAYDMMRNERQFKLQVYPLIGFSLIWSFIFIFDELRNEGLASIASSQMYLNIYFCTIFLPKAIEMMKYSSNYKGAWIYNIAPNKSEALIFTGTIKACIIRLLLPIYSFECIIFMCIFGVKIFPNLIIVFLNILLAIVIYFKNIKKALPFSQSFEAVQQNGSLDGISFMAVLGALVLAHYICILISFGIYVYMGFVIIAIIRLKKANI